VFQSSETIVIRLRLAILFGFFNGVYILLAFVEARLVSVYLKDSTLVVLFVSRFGLLRNVG
jgi:hypothetical protein